jgi:hypothetical protein
MICNKYMYHLRIIPKHINHNDCLKSSYKNNHYILYKEIHQCSYLNQKRNVQQATKILLNNISISLINLIYIVL